MAKGGVVKESGRPTSALVNVFAWLNWFLSAVCVIFFLGVLVFAFLKVDAKWEDKIYALIIMFIATLFPAIFFFINGLILKSKDSNAYEKEKIDEF